MGSQKGWQSVGRFGADILTGGGYSAGKYAKKMAAAQENAAKEYAAAQERVAAAIESSSQVAPKAVQAGAMGVQEAAEGNAQAAQKRKRTIASTVAPGWGSSILGGVSRL